MNSAAWMSFRSAAEQPDRDDPPGWKPGHYVKCRRCGRFVSTEVLKITRPNDWDGAVEEVWMYPCRCGEPNVSLTVGTF